MANLDIAERRMPQDGRVKLKVGGRDLDTRISILPTPYGETINIRLLYPAMLVSLEKLGFEEDHLWILQDLLKRSHGVILVTGPTGSGKTTTLYSCLSQINKSAIKIVTIEDPVEYPLYGISQMEVFPKIGFTFATGLRSILRHDPDVIMIGEMRDSETAEIAIRSALTGHLVMSTLHTNDAISSITRLIDMGVEPYLIVSTVQCIIAQRLVRKLCAHCCLPMENIEEILRQHGIEVSSLKGVEKGFQLFEKGKGWATFTALPQIVDFNTGERNLTEHEAIEARVIAGIVF
jgi:type II secretory ATPase GspE/PulE/Tfp pilus assembly ATPase PilB-like protein